MSSVTTVTQTGNQLHVTYDVSKFLLGFNSFITANLTASGATTLTEGLVMGQVAATGKIIKWDKDATDGSQYPYGLCVVDQVVADGDTDSITLVNKGRVALSKVDYSDGDIDTQIGPTSNKRTMRALFNDLGLELMGGEELTAVDNS